MLVLCSCCCGVAGMMSERNPALHRLSKGADTGHTLKWETYCMIVCIVQNLEISK